MNGYRAAIAKGHGLTSLATHRYGALDRSRVCDIATDGSSELLRLRGPDHNYAGNRCVAVIMAGTT